MRVPVLSEKMYWICPSSSLRVVVLAWEEVRVRRWWGGEGERGQREEQERGEWREGEERGAWTLAGVSAGR